MNTRNTIMIPAKIKNWQIWSNFKENFHRLNETKMKIIVIFVFVHWNFHIKWLMDLAHFYVYIKVYVHKFDKFFKAFFLIVNMRGPQHKLSNELISIQWRKKIFSFSLGILFSFVFLLSIHYNFIHKKHHWFRRSIQSLSLLFCSHSSSTFTLHIEICLNFLLWFVVAVSFFV